jgi:hypothetical protein
MKMFKTIALVASLMFTASGSVFPVQAEDAKGPYPTMAPLDQYLMADRDAEIALAKSAAPATISNDAEVLILSKDGYHTAIEGKNGFTCIVERSWMNPVDSQEFWNPKVRGPICYNPQASRSILPYTIQRTRLALKGLTQSQIADSMKAALNSNLIPLPEAGAMSYMLSKDGYLGDTVGHWHPHLMFHIANASAASWGANQPDSPVFLIPPSPEPESIFLVAVGHWSDGSPVEAEGSAAHQH